MTDMNDKMFKAFPKITPLFGRRIPRTFRQWCWWNLRGRPEGEEEYEPGLMSTAGEGKLKWHDEPVEPKTDMEKRLVEREVALQKYRKVRAACERILWSRPPRKRFMGGIRHLLQKDAPDD